MSKNPIITEARTKCPACNSLGDLLYSNLTDKIFNIQGEWNMRKCCNKKCGTLWLDPTPKESELSKLYTNYYTHQGGALVTSAKDGLLRAILSNIRISYLSMKYGYEPLSPLLKDRLLGFIAYLHPAWRDTQSADIFYLPAKKGGKLLDVGCGSGATMQIMSQKGWVVTGIDFDEGAINNAKNKGLDAHLGELSTQGFESETFDAIVMGHVIEHVPHPAELISECRRILKKDGLLVITTPTADSPCSKYYGENWRGLETPRHLQIFTTKSLAQMARNIGYRSVKSFTSMQGDFYIWSASRDLARNNKHRMGTRLSLYNRIILHTVNFIIGWINVFIPGHSEVAVVICKK